MVTLAQPTERCEPPTTSLLALNSPGASSLWSRPRREPIATFGVVDPTTSFVLALVAIVVSGFSAIASFIAIGQNARHHPRPHFEIALSRPHTDPGRPAALAVISNYGNAPARDVRLRVQNRTTGWSGEIWHHVELAPSSESELGLSLATGSVEFDNVFGVVKYRSGPPLASRIDLRLTWRQWPGVKRLRRVRWTVRTTAEGEASIGRGRELGWVSQVIVETASGVVDVLSEVWSTIRRIF